MGERRQGEEVDRAHSAKVHEVKVVRPTPSSHIVRKSSANDRTDDTPSAIYEADEAYVEGGLEGVSGCRDEVQGCDTRISNPFTIPRDFRGGPRIGESL